MMEAGNEGTSSGAVTTDARRSPRSDDGDASKATVGVYLGALSETRERERETRRRVGCVRECVGVIVLVIEWRWRHLLCGHMHHEYHVKMQRVS
jgi:hypothetical protein